MMYVESALCYMSFREFAEAYMEVIFVKLIFPGFGNIKIKLWA